MSVSTHLGGAAAGAPSATPPHDARRRRNFPLDHAILQWLRSRKFLCRSSADGHPSLSERAVLLS